MDMNLRIYLAVVFSLATLPATAQPAQSAQNGEPVPAASGIADGNAPHRETAPGQGQSTGSAAARDATAGHQAVPDDTSTDALAVIPLPPEPAAPPASADTGEDAVYLDEIVVTATKRKESIRTLAGAVTAVTRERLDETGSSNFADYLALSPGVNLNSGSPRSEEHTSELNSLMRNSSAV